MKVGAENRTSLIVAVVLMAVAVGSVIYAVSGPSTPAASTATPAATAATGTARPATTAANKNASPANSIDPTLRLDFLKASEDIEYLGKGRNIFRAQAEAPVEIPKPVVDPRKQPEVAKGPPPPPPILLKFFGFANRTGENKKIFLSQNDDIFVAAEGDIVKGRYKILRINPTSIEVEDVLNNNRQSIPLTQS